MRSAYAHATGRYDNPQRLPSAERLQQLERDIDEKLARATALRAESVAIRAQLATLDPAGATAFARVEDLDRARADHANIRNELWWDLAGVRARPPSDALRTDDHVKDLAKQAAVARGKLEGAERELRAARNADYVRYYGSLQEATRSSSDTLMSLRNQGRDELDTWSSAEQTKRIQLGVRQLQEKVGDPRAFLSTPGDVAFMGKPAQVEKISRVAREFHDLNLGLDEAQAWLSDPRSFEQRLDTLKRIQNKRDLMRVP